jgi:hypothetical protein
MPAEAARTVQRVYDAVKQLLATQPDDADGVTANQIAEHTGLALPTVNAALELLASRLIIRVARPGDPLAVMAIPVEHQPLQGDHDHPTANP